MGFAARRGILAGEGVGAGFRAFRVGKFGIRRGLGGNEERRARRVWGCWLDVNGYDVGDGLGANLGGLTERAPRLQIL